MSITGRTSQTFIPIAHADWNHLELTEVKEKKKFSTYSWALWPRQELQYLKHLWAVIKVALVQLATKRIGIAEGNFLILFFPK